MLAFVGMYATYYLIFGGAQMIATMCTFLTARRCLCMGICRVHVHMQSTCAHTFLTARRCFVSSST